MLLQVKGVLEAYSLGHNVMNCVCYVPLLERCPHFRGWYICRAFNGVGTQRCVPIREVASFQWYVQDLEHGPKDVSLLERSTTEISYYSNTYM